MTTKKAKCVAKKYIQRMERFSRRGEQSMRDLYRYGDRRKLIGKRIGDLPYQSEWFDALCKSHDYALFGRTGVFVFSKRDPD